MKQEVKAGVDFLKRMLVARGKINNAKAEVFTEKLLALLCDKFKDHWYPECPSRGQAYRCIRINLVTPWDKEVQKACDECEVTPINLGLPPELTLWIDPLEVSARYKESGWPFTVARFDIKEKMQSAEGGQHDTSDYHSATSSDCSSTASSDTEEEAKDGEMDAESGNKENIKKEEMEGSPYRVTMVPRIRGHYAGKTNRAKYYKMMPAAPQVFHPPQPLWCPYESSGPVFITPVCTSVAQPPPPVFNYYLLQHPQFVMPQANLQPLGYFRH